MNSLLAVLSKRKGRLTSLSFVMLEVAPLWNASYELLGQVQRTTPVDRNQSTRLHTEAVPQSR